MKKNFFTKFFTFLITISLIAAIDMSVLLAEEVSPVFIDNLNNSCQAGLFRKIYDSTFKTVTRVPFIPGLIEKAITKTISLGAKARIKLLAGPMESAPPMVEIVSNNGEYIVLKIGKLQKSSSKLFYAISFNDKVVSNINCMNIKQDNIIEIPVKKTGKYTITFYRHSNGKNFAYYEGILWEQDFLGIAKNELPFSSSEINKVAERYAPISLFSDDEEYRPGSLEYIFNLVDIDEKLAQTKVKLNFERFRTLLAFKFNDANKFLPFWGDNDGVFDTISYVNGGINNVTEVMQGMLSRKNKLYNTIYYSLIPNPDKGEYYLIYHYLYSFDEKTGSENDPSRGKHVFDRESFAIVLNSDLLPQSIVYGAHMEGQKLNIVDADKNIIQSSSKGRIRLSWEEAYKYQEHPLVAIAKGSHAIYPAIGNYTFTILKDKLTLLSEPAGGKNLLLPSDLQLINNSIANEDNSGIVDYNADKGESLPTKIFLERFALRSLDIGEITSHSWNNVLAFSGNLVDVLGWNDAKFPPFTEREIQTALWVNEADWGDSSKMPEASYEAMRQIIGELSQYMENKTQVP
ncbi:MAG: hypothetical protein A2385_01890 [Bdellovibrionales bacterium RIFOXYB1_FULL_39_21]|nr:MAG: hypothetical protein A2385_01890 [Bdellovibrionales bacterium RIFOXYB1_FULL_39_21]OFZ43653.1 MAG: hypothetical protein A2485_15880 [Bdellovibrionales bacterium RIFOXYC12_FULL_39_17]OFZ47588.1 MAG: hypothetical protein A2404_14060 [Bdellovibrionales bacterium RIFOXYC1_FULL_39_130]OFZ76114.1 MAG: hypothetical protein A2560_16650 [Bdellovibrionales bacterium RIFOXYD1_FULL_39_84]